MTELVTRETDRLEKQRAKQVASANLRAALDRKDKRLASAICAPSSSPPPICVPRSTMRTKSAPRARSEVPLPAFSRSSSAVLPSRR